jgi:putative DNA primase/helicase
LDKEAILQALNVEGFFREELGDLFRKGARWFARCPFHADNDPSLSLDLEKGLYKCFGCDAGGDVIDFYMRRRGLEFKEALTELAARTGISNQPGAGDNQKKFVSLTLEEFSRAKKLPLEFLAGHGVRQETHSHYGTSRVEFPYYDGRKKLAAVRLRYGGKSREQVKFLWRQGDKARLYGLWRLAEFKAGGWVLLVEGESDALTCWRHGLPALGLPGKENYATLRPVKALLDLEVYLWQEPDAAALPGKVANILPRVKVIKAPAAYKDLSEAHVAGQDVAALVAELKKGAQPPAPPSVITGGYSLSDLGNARRLVAQHGQDLRYSYRQKAWYVWDGRVWAEDFAGEVERRAKDVIRGLYQEAGRTPDLEERKRLAQFALKSEEARKIIAIVRLAQSEAGVPVQPEELDANPWLLNVANGTLDLRTGELQPHRREDLITCLAPVAYEPEAECEEWEKFLYRIQANNAAKCFFLQQALGYTLTGSTREQCLFILWGHGRNGKSTLLNAVRKILGNYARHTPTETLLARNKGGEIPADVARLDGPRFVTASEVDKGRRLAESLIKELTGQDTVSARFLWGHFFDFQPQFKLFISTNNKPQVRGTDDAIWRRIHFVEFPVQIPKEECDTDLPDKLLAEAPGLLAWMVRGCMDWYKHGLEVPEEVRQATAAYRAEMDALQEFLEDACLVGPGLSATAKALYEAYTDWAGDQGIKEKDQLKQRTFGIMLAERGFAKDKGTAGQRLWRGLGLQIID